MYIDPKIIKTLETILIKRAGQHGSFKNNSENYYAMKEYLREAEVSQKLTAEDHLACDMILVKLSRIKENPKNEDHWIDIIGYAIHRLNSLIKVNEKNNE